MYDARRCINCTNHTGNPARGIRCSAVDGEPRIEEPWGLSPGFCPLPKTKEKEPWPGYEKWNRDAKKYQRECELSTARFGVFAYCVSYFLGLLVYLRIGLSAVDDLGAGAAPIILGVGFVYYLIARLMYDAFGMDENLERLSGRVKKDDA